jgi:hypothetical protein
LGERLLCKQEVIGSIPFTSTIGTSTIGGTPGVCDVRRRARHRCGVSPAAEC